MYRLIVPSVCQLRSRKRATINKILFMFSIRQRMLYSFVISILQILSTAGNVEFTDPLEAVRREAKLLNDKGVDIIIVLSHCGLDIDK